MLTVPILIGAPMPAAAANYGADSYGGGPFNTGVDPPPPPPPQAPPPSSGGGVVIGGPLGIGYVVTNATTTPTIVTSVPVFGPAPSAAPASTTINREIAAPQFLRRLRVGDTGSDVQHLQTYLNSHGFRLGTAGPGSPGDETERFGALTYRALIKFQTANAAAILAPLGLSKATGVLGSSTIAFIGKTSR